MRHVDNELQYSFIHHMVHQHTMLIWLRQLSVMTPLNCVVYTVKLQELNAFRCTQVTYLCFVEITLATTFITHIHININT